MRTVYVIGYPGSGKSTAVAGVLDVLGAGVGLAVEKPVPHLRYKADGRSVWEMGRRREAFSGTDALAMSIQPVAVRWVQALVDPGASAPDVLIGEGDRLATRGFLDACPGLTLVRLSVPLEVVTERATARALMLGRSAQDPSWFRGRVTKVDRVAAHYDSIEIDATASAAQVAMKLAEVVRGCFT